MILDRTKIIGFIGLVLIIIVYILLWIPPETELEEVLLRTRLAIMVNTAGCLMVIYYLYQKSK